MLDYIALVIFILCALGGIALSFLSIGGTFIIVAGAVLYNLITWSWTLSLNTLIILLALAIVGEILEFVITALGIKVAKVSRWGLAGMIICAFAGASILSTIPVVGSLIGLVFGAALGAYIGELIHTGDAKKALKAAKVLILGRGLIIFAKVTLAIIQIWITLAAIW